MRHPLVTVVLATYNGAHFLPEQLDSLARQSLRPGRLVLRDDGSGDSSVALVQQWGQREGIDVQPVPFTQRLGPARSFLTALAAAGDADVYLFCDQDDVWLPEKIACAARALASAPAGTPHLHATRLCIVDSQLRKLALSPVPRHLCFASAACESVLTGCTMAFNAALHRLLVRGVPKDLVMHDWWCYQVAAATGVVSYDPEPRVLYRQHGHNALGAGPSGWRKLRARVRQFLGPDSSQRSRQLLELARLIGADLPPSAVELIAQLTAGRQRPLVRWQAAFSAPLRRQSILSEMSTRFSLLTNRF